MTVGEESVAWLWGLAPSLGRTRPVGVDGFSGAGKSTFARWIAELDPAVSVVKIEMFYPGWDGLEEGTRRAREALVEPLRRREAPVVRWTWGISCCWRAAGRARGCCGAQESAPIRVDAAPTERERRLRAREGKRAAADRVVVVAPGPADDTETDSGPGE